MDSKERDAAESTVRSMDRTGENEQRKMEIKSQKGKKLNEHSGRKRGSNK